MAVPGCLVVRNQLFHCHCWGSIPACEPEIPQATQSEQKKKKKGSKRKCKWLHTKELSQDHELFSAEALQTRSKWHDIIKEMKGRNLQPKIAYPARLSFRFEVEMKSCADKQKLKVVSLNWLYKKCYKDFSKKN